MTYKSFGIAHCGFLNPAINLLRIRFECMKNSVLGSFFRRKEGDNRAFFLIKSPFDVFLGRIDVLCQNVAPYLAIMRWCFVIMQIQSALPVGRAQILIGRIFSSFPPTGNGVVKMINDVSVIQLKMAGISGDHANSLTGGIMRRSMKHGGRKETISRNTRNARHNGRGMCHHGRSLRGTGGHGLRCIPRIPGMPS